MVWDFGLVLAGEDGPGDGAQASRREQSVLFRLLLILTILIALNALNALNPTDGAKFQGRLAQCGLSRAGMSIKINHHSSSSK